MAKCGVDFGTSNSALCLPTGEVLPIDPRGDVPRLLRSLLFFPDQERDTLVGAEAIARYLDEPAGRFIQSIKSWLPSRSFQATQIRNRAVSIEDLVALILRALRARACEHGGVPMDEVVLGRPAVFSADAAADQLAEHRLRQAAALAGFSRVTFLIEPIAAALAYEATLERDETVLVGDFGAGTSDFTLMRVGPSRRGNRSRREDVIGSSGVRVGGDRFDAAIMKHKLLPKFGSTATYGTKRQRLPQHLMSKLLSWHEMSFIRDRDTLAHIREAEGSSDQPGAVAALHDLVAYNLGYQLFRAIEQAKIALSSQLSARVVFAEERIALDEGITREEFDQFTRPLIDELATCVDRLLVTVGDQQIDSVFLTGGSSRIPAVHQLFERRFGAGRVRSGDAFTSVAEGLGRAAESV